MSSLFVVIKGFRVAERRYFGFYTKDLFLSIFDVQKRDHTYHIICCSNEPENHIHATRNNTIRTSYTLFRTTNAPLPTNIPIAEPFSRPFRPLRSYIHWAPLPLPSFISTLFHPTLPALPLFLTTLSLCKTSRYWGKLRSCAGSLEGGSGRTGPGLGVGRRKL